MLCECLRSARPIGQQIKDLDVQVEAVVGTDVTDDPFVRLQLGDQPLSSVTTAGSRSAVSVAPQQPRLLLRVDPASSRPVARLCASGWQFSCIWP